MEFYIVDAFTETLFGGNPAGIVLLSPGEEYPSDEVMKRTAAELRYSETVFIRQNMDGGFRLRYFTPTDEVDLCGHATIGAFSALCKRDHVSAGKSYLCETLAGRISVSVENGLITMDMATPEERGTIDKESALEELCRIMDLSVQDIEVFVKGKRLYPEIISTGLPDILLPVVSRRKLERIRPDHLALAALSQRYGVTGVHAFSFGEIGGDVTAYCRNFAPAFGIKEEAATGTSNGALTYYLYKNDLLKNGDSCLFIQGESMGRPSRIVSAINVRPAEDETRPPVIDIRIGGSGVILAEGEIHI